MPDNPEQSNARLATDFIEDQASARINFADTHANGCPLASKTYKSKFTVPVKSSKGD